MITESWRTFANVTLVQCLAMVTNMKIGIAGIINNHRASFTVALVQKYPHPCSLIYDIHGPAKLVYNFTAILLWMLTCRRIRSSSFVLNHALL